MRKNFLISAILLSILFLNAGWVTRSITVESDPPGADVYFDDKIVGKSPASFDFMWYAKHNIRLEKEGFEILEVKELIRAPFFMWIPIDLVSETLPISLKDIRKFSYKLLPKEIQKTQN